MRKSPPALTLLCSLALLTTGSTLAQTETTTTTTASTTVLKPNMRFFQQFATDAAIVEKQWYGAELRYQSGAVPPVEEADGWLLTPTIAISLFKNLEVGGSVSYISYDLDHPRPRPGDLDDFDGDSGLGDLTMWGKYRFFDTGTVSVTAGALLTLPTGSDDDGLGTGEVGPAGFAAVRVKAGDGYFLGEAGIRFNQDASIFETELDGRNSTFFGGGYLWEGYENWVFSGEVTAESERFEDDDSVFDLGASDFRGTAGVQYLFPHQFLRGAVSLGFSDGAPDFELIFGYAYHF
jgi:hypothetical protein